MTAELLHAIALATLAFSAALLIVLALRRPLRAAAGARAVYVLWLLAPLAVLAACVPAPQALSALRVMPVVDATLATAALAAPAALGGNAASWLAWSWLLGAATAVAFFMRQQMRFVRGLGVVSVLGDGVFAAEATLGLPALVGAWRPRIVLPADFAARYDPAERALIFAHERCHRRRGDAQVNALAALLRALFWFNPLVHLAASRFRFDQELACDAAVLARFPEARRPYARAMLKTQLADLGLPAGCHWQSIHPLRERIDMLKQPLPGRLRAASGLAVAIALVAGGTAIAWAAQASPDAGGSYHYATAAEFDHYAAPHYPPEAVKAHQQGRITLKIAVDASGVPLSAEVYAADPPESKEVFAEGSIATALTWRFKPKENGRAAPEWVLVPVTYALHDLD